MAAAIKPAEFSSNTVKALILSLADSFCSPNRIPPSWPLSSIPGAKTVKLEGVIPSAPEETVIA